MTAPPASSVKGIFFLCFSSVFLLFHYLPAHSQAPAHEGFYRIYYVGVDQLKLVSDWLQHKLAATGCQTGLDGKELVSCSLVQF
jgi:hypothetical protein